MSDTLTILVSGFGIAMVAFLFGTLLMSFGQNRPDEERSGRTSLALGRLTLPFASLWPWLAKARQDIKREVMQAGYYQAFAAEQFLALRNATVVAWLLLISGLLATLDPPDFDRALPILIAGAVVGIVLFGLPRLWLGWQARARVERIQYALPDALDMVSMMVTGGVPLRDALGRVGDELKGTYPDVACELRIIQRQADAGTLQLALHKFAERIDSPDVKSLAVLVRHAEQLGGRVAAALLEYADQVRRQRRQMADEQGNKASVKLLLPVVLFLAPPIYVLLLGPAVLEMKDFLTRENQPGGILAPDTQMAAPVEPGRLAARRSGR